MTNEQMIEDLKQFITTAVSQATANVATKDDIARVETKIDHLSEQVSDLNLKVDTIADANSETVNDHEQRLTRLEQAGA